MTESPTLVENRKVAAGLGVEQMHFRSPALLFLITFVAILMLGMPSVAIASDQESTEDSSPGGVLTGVRLWVWVISGYGGAEFGFGTDAPVLAMVGGSLGVELEDLYLLEGGGSLLFGTSQPAFELFLRGGIELDILDGRGGSKACWRLSWLALLGYRYVRFGSEADGGPIHEGNHCVAVNTGFELMRHSIDGSGVGFRLLFGGSVPFAQDDSGWNSRYDSTTLIFDSYLALVLAF